eukprot:NODE_1476_length_1404_cov_72.596310_g1225_i0.p1 GENE.NODE_1476_length_1404_cov_72.596310_g1225_i0~~NODE_1476_length_1404_cov_72.596310_g1225_i0.p1  ORF type:complete len:433 (+),score=143.33 NODE_1476_length_1404_cov_72.596310_g1225_i0:50-1348(+)
MSFREIRKFIEIMKHLGYQRLISMESFRTPNPELTTEIIMWLMIRHDPTFDIADDISTEPARIRFLKEVGEQAMTRLHIKLNLRKLYSADGHAINELLKLATVLRDAVDLKQPPGEEIDPNQFKNNAVHSKESRNLAQELTADGARLFELLGNESGLRDSRNRVVQRPADSYTIENALQASVLDCKQSAEKLNDDLTKRNNDESMLENKIMHSKAEYERLQKQLRKLSGTRPAFQDDYDKCEAELHALYKDYLEHYRNLEYLESEVNKYKQKEQAALEEHENKLKILRQKLSDEVRNLKGEMTMEEAADLDIMHRQQAAANIRKAEAESDAAFYPQQATPQQVAYAQQRQAPQQAQVAQGGNKRPLGAGVGGKRPKAEASGNVFGDDDDEDDSDLDDGEEELDSNAGADDDDDEDDDDLEDDDDDDDDDDEM